MNLPEIFRSLKLPTVTEGESFESERLPGYSKFRLGVNVQGLPALLLDIGKSQSLPVFKNLKLKNLVIQHGIQCLVSESGTSTLELLTVIKFLSTDAELQVFF